MGTRSSYFWTPHFDENVISISTKCVFSICDLPLSILKDGVKVEPKGEVKVEVKRIDGTIPEGTVNVVHFVESSEESALDGEGIELVLAEEDPVLTEEELVLTDEVADHSAPALLPSVIDNELVAVIATLHLFGTYSTAKVVTPHPMAVYREWACGHPYQVKGGSGSSHPHPFLTPEALVESVGIIVLAMSFFLS